VRIQDLGVGASACYPLSIGFQTANYSIWVLFHSTTENGDPNTQSAYAYITRTGTTTWTARPDGPCPVTASWAGVWPMQLNVKKAQRVFKGYWNLPFLISFRLK